MLKTKILSTLSLIGDDFNPEIITTNLKIQPTNIWRKGDFLPKNKLRTRLENVWEYSTGYQECNDVDILLKIIVEKFSPLIDDINQLKEKYTLTAKVFVVIHIENAEVPAQYYDQKTINFMHRLQAELDVDLYVMS